MYCEKCGKQLADGEVCDCDKATTPITEETPAAQETAFGTVYATTAVQPQGDRKYGFKPALAATIISGVATFIIYIVVSFVLVFSSELLPELEAGATLNAEGVAIVMKTCVTCIVLSVFCLGACVPSLILGIKSIKRFVEKKKAGEVKPVATLVLGIVSCSLCALTIILALCTVLMSTGLLVYV